MLYYDLTASRALLLQDLDSLRQNEPTVHPLGAEEADLALGGEQLIEPLEGAALAVGDPVVAEVAEDDGLGPGSDGRHIGGGLDGTAQDGIRGVGNQTGLPEVLAVVVLQLADGQAIKTR